MFLQFYCYSPAIMFSISSVILGISFIVFLIHKWFHNHWLRLGFPFEPPHWFWGNFMGAGRSRSIDDIIQKIYDRYRSSTISGMFVFLKPVTVVCDLDLVNKILGKDFEQFSDRGLAYDRENDPLTRNLFTMDLEAWKPMRSLIYHGFNGASLKILFPIVDQVTENLLEKIRSSNGHSIQINDLFMKYMMDIMGHCALGLDCNTMNDPESVFLEMEDLLFKKSRRSPLRILCGTFFSKFARKIGLQKTNPEVTSFYLYLAQACLDHYPEEEEEESQKKFENAIISMIKLVKKNEMTLEELAAHIYLLNIGSFETTSSTLTYLFYELTVNKDIQKKLRKEFERVLLEFKGELTFESLNEMKYLDQVVNETLRKYPAGRTIFRRVTKGTYEIPGTEMTLKKNDLLVISVVGIHNNPLIYPNPSEFDPERFKPEEVKKRHPLSFIPFGKGPKMCVGWRFATLVMKVSLVKILLTFRCKRGFHFPETLESTLNTRTNTPNSPVNVRFVEIPGKNK